ncbi:MAG: M48 family metallopeptidase [candidate division WOR-3 bacterium]|nr:M48 family metallopeptidase [candidate division WOR-3 bacterium]MCX7836832.1 M48 family metallopeptidase [candidate division WOR-3 bacterium]MDW8114298.1 M48 family metallopeptidase [candidate division WOR-3 bacterium]
MANNFKELIFSAVEEFAKILKVKPKEIVFRKMKRRWGSCKKDKIILNKNLEFLPEDLIRYVIYHEMCHLLIKNHRKDFKLLIEKIYPDYKLYEKRLSSYSLLINNFLKT